MAQSNGLNRKARRIKIGLAVFLCLGLLAVAYIGIPVGWVLSRSLARNDFVKFENPKLKLIPFIGVFADNISISDPANAKLKIASIRRAFLELPFTELFADEPRLSSVSLSGVSLFADRLPRSSLPELPKDKLPPIDRVRIEDGSVAFADAPGGQGESVVLDHIDAELTFKSGAPPSLNAHATSGSYKISILATANEARPDADSFFPVSASVDVAEPASSLMRASFLFTENAAANLITGRTTSATVQSQPFDARATIDSSHKKVAVAVSADFGSLTLPISLFSPAASTEPQAGSAKDPAALSKDLPDITFQVSAKEVKAPPIDLAPAYAEGTLSNGELNVRVSRTIANGGKLSGELTLKSAGGARSSFQLAGASLPLTGLAPVSGSLDVEGSLDTANQPDPVGSLSGDVTFNIRNGAVKAPPLLRIVEALYAGIQSHGLLNAGGELPFSLLDGKVRINHGIATSDNLLFQSPAIRASGHAQADLKKRVIHFSFYPELPNGDQSSGQWKKLPVAVEVTGSFDDPQFSINANGTIINSEKVNELQSRAADLLGLKEENRAAIRDAIKGLGGLLFDDGKTERGKQED